MRKGNTNQAYLVHNFINFGYIDKPRKAPLTEN